MSRTLALLLFLIATALPAAAQSTRATTTKPASAPTAASDRNFQRAVDQRFELNDRYLKAVAGLSDAQRTETQSKLDAARAELATLASARDVSPAARADRAVAIFTRMRSQVREILPAGSRPGVPQVPDVDSFLAIAEPAATKVAGTRPAPFAGPDAGEPFSPFRLTRVDGKLETNETLMGKPAVVIFGSWSAPSFRDQLPRVADLATRYGGRVNWLVVYTRELWPTDSAATTAPVGPERNRDEKIDAPAARSDADRMAAAKRLVERLKLKLQVAPDAIDDRLATGAQAFPNAAFVLDARGNVVAKLDWAEPFTIKRHLDRLLAAPRVAP